MGTQLIFQRNNVDQAHFLSVHLFQQIWLSLFFKRHDFPQDTIKGYAGAAFFLCFLDYRYYDCRVFYCMFFLWDAESGPAFGEAFLEVFCSERKRGRFLIFITSKNKT